jgi:nucleoid-associated protein YgaU
MSLQRYSNEELIDLGKQYGTATAHTKIRNAIKNGVVEYNEEIIKGFERLDTIAGKYYGDGNLWWVIAAASNIGWALQLPPGTLLYIPNLEQVRNILG